MNLHKRSCICFYMSRVEAPFCAGRDWAKKFQGLKHAVLRLAGGETSLDDATLPVTLRGEPSVPFRRRNGFIVDATFTAERLRRVYAQKSRGHCVRTCVRCLEDMLNRTSALRTPRDALATAGPCFWTRLTCEGLRSVERRCSNFNLERSPRRKTI